MKRIGSILLWTAISCLGALSIGLLALNRGESVNAIWLVTAGLCTLAVSYRFYSKWLITKVLVLDPHRAPPAVTHQDGIDYVPTHRWMVFGHHFAAIAGPGPLVGPVLAAQFGYLPGTLWLLVGATLGGGVHDLIILFSSIRRGGKSLGQMVKEEIGPEIGIVCIVSVLAILVILLSVLGLVVVKAMAESPWGVFTVAMTIPIAFLMGCGLRYTKLGIGWVSILGVLGLLASVWAGQYLHQFPGIETWFLQSDRRLAWAVMIYGVSATALPVWLLLAPRDYLSTFLKLGAVALLAVAILILQPQLHMPALTRFIDGTGLVFAGPVFPFVCITIACGAVSGFHSLVASGTTPKLIEREPQIRMIGYGAMVVEMVVGLMALTAACALEPGQYFAINMKGPAAEVVAHVTAAGFPVTEAGMSGLAAEIGEKTMIGRTGGAPTFAVGMAKMFSKAFADSGALALWYHFAIMFEVLFILPTIDAGTRVGRFLFQDLLAHIWKPLGNTKSWTANLVTSIVFVAAWGYFLYQGVIDPLGGINSLWPIFGIANQLLAVIALSLGSVILIKMGKQRYLAVTAAPLAFLVAVTFSAGWIKIFSPDPKLGFLSAAAEYDKQIGAASLPEQIHRLQTLAFNMRLDAVVTGGFLILVLVIVAGALTHCVRMLRGTLHYELKESPFVALPEQG
ncbi:MAG: carbon starvation CstA family protein [Methylacidiphilales bacterium]|nr:carbon starvation CstA family protein [Candidatus Methylacidiphilales bacterium]